MKITAVKIEIIFFIFEGLMLKNSLYSVKILNNFQKSKKKYFSVFYFNTKFMFLLLNFVLSSNIMLNFEGSDK